jgi:hypothetical protein
MKEIKENNVNLAPPPSVRSYEIPLSEPEQRNRIRENKILNKMTSGGLADSALFKRVLDSMPPEKQQEKPTGQREESPL